MLETIASFIMCIRHLSDEGIQCGSSDLERNVERLEPIQKRPSQIGKHFLKKMKLVRIDKIKNKLICSQGHKGFFIIILIRGSNKEKNYIKTILFTF